eukprot:m.98220 g.98220  ORF g.98220 m.98220 type:complete len:1087 (-) comp14002_c0_seq1:34-3294(-)
MASNGSALGQLLPACAGLVLRPCGRTLGMPSPQQTMLGLRCFQTTSVLDSDRPSGGALSQTSKLQQSASSTLSPAAQPAAFEEMDHATLIPNEDFMGGQNSLPISVPSPGDMLKAAAGLPKPAAPQHGLLSSLTKSSGKSAQPSMTLMNVFRQSSSPSSSESQGASNRAGKLHEGNTQSTVELAQMLSSASSQTPTNLISTNTTLPTRPSSFSIPTLVSAPMQPITPLSQPTSTATATTEETTSFSSALRSPPYIARYVRGGPGARHEINSRPTPAAHEQLTAPPAIKSTDPSPSSSFSSVSPTVSPTPVASTSNPKPVPQAAHSFFSALSSVAATTANAPAASLLSAIGSPLPPTSPTSPAPSASSLLSSLSAAPVTSNAEQTSPHEPASVDAAPTLSPPPAAAASADATNAGPGPATGTADSSAASKPTPRKPLTAAQIRARSSLIAHSTRVWSDRKTAGAAQRTAHSSVFTLATLADTLDMSQKVLQEKISEIQGEAVKKSDLLLSETVELLLADLGYDVTAAEQRLAAIRAGDRPKRLIPAAISHWPARPPVVTILGHVDHGKTTLLDTLRKASVAAGEAGGITQHIGAFSVKLAERCVTFMDTPGHAAFSAMRARGASATDVIILVVAADDGVQPQTIECISIALASGAPIVVAISKCDKADADPEKVRSDLLRHGLQLEKYGGDVQTVEISAAKGKGLDELLSAVLIAADLADLRAPHDGRAEAVAIEARTDKGRGHIVTALVRMGTLRSGAYAVCGKTYARIRSLQLGDGTTTKTALPSEPVEISGWKDLPTVGDDIIEVESEAEARNIVAHRIAREQQTQQESDKLVIDQKREQDEMELDRARMIKDPRKRLALAKAAADAAAGDDASEPTTPVFRVTLKGDVAGSVEALAAALEGLSTPRVQLEVLRAGVGPVCEADVEFASTFGAPILCFAVTTPGSVTKLAALKGVPIHTNNIIYEILDHAKERMCDLLPPTLVPVVTGRAEVLQVFHLSGPKRTAVAGCRVQTGQLARKEKFRVTRDGTVVFEGSLSAMKQFKDDVINVSQGNDCGLSFAGFDDLREGDVIECFVIKSERARLD